MLINTIIIDDEIDAIESLKLIIKEFIPDLNIIGTADKISEAHNLIEKVDPDLIFLDIEMPFQSGIEFLKGFSKRNFEVIFVTAYNNYALDAFKVNAVDYLLKPVNINELKQAIERVYQRISGNQNPKSLDPLYEHLKVEMFQKIAISTQNGTEYLKKIDIIHVEADNSYSTIYLKNRKLTTSRSLKEIELLINSKSFYRTHKSHLINLNQLVRYSLKNGIAIEMSDGSKIPLARRNKDEFLKLVGKLIS